MRIKQVAADMSNIERKNGFHILWNPFLLVKKIMLNNPGTIFPLSMFLHVVVVYDVLEHIYTEIL